MRKLLTVTILMILLSSVASAAYLSDYPEFLLNENQFNVNVVVGDHSPSSDTWSAYDLTYDLMGEPIYVLSDTMQEGDVKTYTIDGKDYEIEAYDIDGEEVTFIVNGELAYDLEEADGYDFFSGIRIEVDDIFLNFVEFDIASIMHDDSLILLENQIDNLEQNLIFVGKAEDNSFVDEFVGTVNQGFIKLVEYADYFHMFVTGSSKLDISNAIDAIIQRDLTQSDEMNVENIYFSGFKNAVETETKITVNGNKIIVDLTATNYGDLAFNDVGFEASVWELDLENKVVKEILPGQTVTQTFEISIPEGTDGVYSVDSALIYSGYAYYYGEYQELVYVQQEVAQEKKIPKPTFEKIRFNGDITAGDMMSLSINMDDAPDNSIVKIIIPDLGLERQQYIEDGSATLNLDLEGVEAGMYPARISYYSDGVRRVKYREISVQ